MFFCFFLYKNSNLRNNLKFHTNNISMSDNINAISTYNDIPQFAIECLNASKHSINYFTESKSSYVF